MDDSSIGGEPLDLGDDLYFDDLVGVPKEIGGIQLSDDQREFMGSIHPNSPIYDFLNLGLPNGLKPSANPIAEQYTKEYWEELIAYEGYTSLKHMIYHEYDKKFFRFDEDLKDEEIRDMECNQFGYFDAITDAKKILNNGGGFQGLKDLARELIANEIKEEIKKTISIGDQDALLYCLAYFQIYFYAFEQSAFKSAYYDLLEEVNHFGDESYKKVLGIAQKPPLVAESWEDIILLTEKYKSTLKYDTDGNFMFDLKVYVKSRGEGINIDREKLYVDKVPSALARFVRRYQGTKIQQDGYLLMKAGSRQRNNTFKNEVSRLRKAILETIKVEDARGDMRKGEKFVFEILDKGKVGVAKKLLSMDNIEKDIEE
ncbi:hypothetical protein LNTAR_25455 [Lentisphaera araneosa HTCC2155]|uniref:Uncharacterized protein n=1 Tax=Lentisphaera araneosa HTCC2155 TaxID=313628 RepID=A6DSD3_9BACT|nr:hypothetical protein [Lentisphaera araneosa]EDM25478.1 hypothetical protein LNTAR_25455 [Lentisphaera araneosa HTCC2155]